MSLLSVAYVLSMMITTSAAFGGGIADTISTAPHRRTAVAFVTPTSSSRTTRRPSSSSTTDGDPFDYVTLPQVLRFRGRVDAGYGRGGKKLGVPTANLPESQFASALQHVTTGVYFGWALVEGDHGGGGGRNVCHKAVVNVGYSPTFAGAENAEKIVEAHLIVADDDANAIVGDFYNETLRLALSGFLREEQKFESFPELVAQIKYDIACATEALSSLSPFVELKTDPFFNNNNDNAVWVGKQGGDETASWEFVDQQTVMDEIASIKK